MDERIVYHDGYLPPPSVTVCTAEEGKTRQSDAKASDINAIMKKYETTGVLPVAARAGVFADVSALPSFQEAIATLDRAQVYFLSLPPHVRAMFENSPAKMLDAFNAGELREVFEEIGLLEKVVPVEPEVPVVP